METKYIAVTGSSGFIGQALLPALRDAGYRPVPVVRRAARPEEIAWDINAGRIEGEKLEGMAAVVHLAGATLATRWTDGAKRRIRESRVEGTRLLARTLAGLERRPPVLISTSAIGLYGDRGDEILTEQSQPGTGFLPDLARAWEASAEPARAAGIRVVHPRFGLVLHPEGGALQKMLTPFRLGAGGRLSSGNQWMSWIALDDLVRALVFLLQTSLEGPVNVTAPQPVRNREFTSTLADRLNRPAVIPVPRAALALLYGGEMVDATLLSSARVMPVRLEEAGFKFTCPDLESALLHLQPRR